MDDNDIRQLKKRKSVMMNNIDRELMLAVIAKLEQRIDELERVTSPHHLAGYD